MRCDRFRCFIATPDATPDATFLAILLQDVRVIKLSDRKIKLKKGGLDYALCAPLIAISMKGYNFIRCVIRSFTVK